MSGKGSRRRPGQGYEDGWDRIFANMHPAQRKLYDEVVEKANSSKKQRKNAPSEPKG